MTFGMKQVAIIVFALHALAELLFGARSFLSGTFSSQTAEEIAALSPQVMISIRFFGAALMSIGLLAVVTLLSIGVATRAGRIIAAVLAFFHIVGLGGVLFTGAGFPEVLTTTQTAGAVVIHGVLALGFLGVILGLRPADRAR